MNPRFIMAALVCAVLALSTTAEAKTPGKLFKGLIERRAVNDKSVTKAKVINVKLSNHKHKAKKLKKGEKNNRPIMARTIREVRVVNVKLADLKAKATQGGGK